LPEISIDEGQVDSIDQISIFAHLLWNSDWRRFWIEKQPFSSIMV
jgi:hypothetical protein